jgi:hypothetical protein
MKVKWLLLLVALCSIFPVAASAQDQPPAMDGPKHPVADELLDNLAGSWKAEGTVVGQPASYTIDADWVLHHQFLRIHLLAPRPIPPSGISYEDMVFISYDHTSERYVCHWMDIYGGRSSESLGFGLRNGQSIEFAFEYPTGPFRTSFRWIPEAGTWQLTMRTKVATGDWVDFLSAILSHPAAQPANPDAKGQ